VTTVHKANVVAGCGQLHCMAVKLDAQYCRQEADNGFRYDSVQEIDEWCVSAEKNIRIIHLWDTVVNTAILHWYC